MGESKRKKLFYGDILIAILWLCYFSNVGFILYGSAILANKMIPERGFSIAMMGMAVGMCNVFQGVSGPFIGFYVGKKGPKRPFALGCAIIAVGAFLIPTFAQTERMYIILYGAVIGFGMALASMNVSQTIVDAWYDMRKPMAMAVVLSAGGIGGFATPIIMNWVVTRWTWQVGWYIVAVACILGAVLTMLLIKDRPSDIGEVRDGLGYIHKRNPSAKVEVKSASEVVMPFSRVLKSIPFYGFTLNYMTRAACFYTLTGYVVLYFTSAGVNAGMAALALSMFSLASLCGRLLFGWIIDVYIDARKGLLVSNVVLCIGMIVVGVLGPTSTLFVILGPVIVGFGHGIGLLSLPLATSKFFGSKNFPLANGIINSSSYLVGSYGPIFTGILAAATGGYTLPFVIIGLIGLVGGILSVIGKAPESDSPMSGPAAVHEVVTEP